jgi:hypothetical protein
MRVQGECVPVFGHWSIIAGKSCRCKEIGEGCDSGTSLDTVETGVLATGTEKEYNICMEGADCTAGLFEVVRTLPEYLSGKMGG